MSPKLDEASQNNQKYRTITDLPVHVFEEICGHLGDNYQKKYWFTFRHVSKSFRNVVGSWNPPKFEKIEFSSTARGLVIHFDGYPVSYFRKSKNWSEINIHNNNEIAYSINQYGNFRDLAVDDLISILISPGGYKLQNLIIPEKIDNGFAQRLSDKFKAVGTNIDVNHVDLYAAKITDPIPVNKVLKLFRSIEKIDIKANRKQRITQKHIKQMIDTINEIDALKNAELVKIDSSLTFRDWKLLIARGYRRYRRWNYQATMLSKLFRLILLNLPHLKYCHIDKSWTRRVEFDENLKELGAKNDPENPNLYKYQIPNSAEYFEIKIRGDDEFISNIYIKRKSNSA